MSIDKHRRHATSYSPFLPAFCSTPVGLLLRPLLAADAASVPCSLSILPRRHTSVRNVGIPSQWASSIQYPLHILSKRHNSVCSNISFRFRQVCFGFSRPNRSFGSQCNPTHLQVFCQDFSAAKEEDVYVPGSLDDEENLKQLAKGFSPGSTSDPILDDVENLKQVARDLKILKANAKLTGQKSLVSRIEQALKYVVSRVPDEDIRAEILAEAEGEEGGLKMDATTEKLRKMSKVMKAKRIMGKGHTKLEQTQMTDRFAALDRQVQFRTNKQILQVQKKVVEAAKRQSQPETKDESAEGEENTFS